MKTKDVIIGQTYDCAIGAERCRVVVLAKVDSHDYRGGKMKPVVLFRVRRENETAWLPKLRSGAHLREV